MVLAKWVFLFRQTVYFISSLDFFIIPVSCCWNVPVTRHTMHLYMVFGSEALFKEKCGCCFLLSGFSLENWEFV